MKGSDRNNIFWMVRAIFIVSFFILFVTHSHTTAKKGEFVYSYSVVTELNNLGGISNLDVIPKVPDLKVLLDEYCLIHNKYSELDKFINRYFFQKIRVLQNNFMFIKPLINRFVFCNNNFIRLKSEVPLG